MFSIFNKVLLPYIAKLHLLVILSSSFNMQKAAEYNHKKHIKATELYTNQYQITKTLPYSRFNISHIIIKTLSRCKCNKLMPQFATQQYQNHAL